MRSLRAFRLLPVPLLAVVMVASLGSAHAFAADPCTPPVTNAVACENTKPGDPPSDWQVNGIGDTSIQGYATQMSVNVGQTVNFKIKTPASSYHIDILRLGYYGGDGARLIQSNIHPSASLPQTQPACTTTSSTGLVECGNWGVSASWAVPSTAVSGLYIAHLVRNDTGGESQIFFVVRDDASHSDLVLKTADTTWQAYNAYGGNSLYSCTVSCPPGEPEGYKAAYAVSYNRPFDGTLSTDAGFSDPFYAEYQLIRFLERNGYDLSYVSGRDLDANGSLLQNHRVFVSSGHDEYWSAGERGSVETARGAGVNLAFFSGNEVFWKTRWTNSSDGSNTPYRTLVDYKDTHFATPVDPLGPTVITPTWRDPRFSPPGDAGRPENSLSGQLFLVNAGTSTIKVPGTFANLRFWRNTAVSKLNSGQTLTLAPETGTLGYEWDVNPDNGFRPPGRISLSSTTVAGIQAFTDYGSEVEDATATHSLSLYRAPSGALIFGAGTVQWSWGLDVTNAWNNSGPDGTEPDPNMQQATVNLLADMGAQPATLEAPLIATAGSTDTTPPTATVGSPADGAALTDGSTVTVSGTAADTGGAVAAVEVSTDGGVTWHTASGTSSWSYPWIVHGSPSTTIRARAVDDSGNIGAVSAPRTVSVSCPCSIFTGTAPTKIDSGDGGSVELGIKFRSDVSGTINGIRFYKSAANTGTHVGSLWTSSGTLLAQANFTGESSSGWQQVTFSSPVAIQPNTTYVAAYFAPNGHYSSTEFAVEHPPAVGPDFLDSSPPLHVLPDTGNGNGLYQYTEGSTFPQNSYQAENYWVDVAFTPTGPAQAPNQVTNVSATAGALQATVNWTPPTGGGTPASYLVTPYIGAAAQTPVSVPAPASSKTITSLNGGTTYTFKVTAVNAIGPGPESAASNPVTPTTPNPPAAPTGVSATAGALQATVNWTAPAGDGGSPITSYRVTPYSAGNAQAPVTVAAPATSKTITGLSGGTSYTFTVAAINALGPGPDSAPSNAVTPTTANLAGAPTGVSATAKSSGAQLSWTAPASDGGSAITGYRITPYIGANAQAATTTGSTLTSASVGGLTNGTAYTFRVAAINGAGTGPDSSPSSSITPFVTIFDLATPGVVDSGDNGAVELGVKFRSDVAGTISGIRFYKSAANTGTHVGSLWNATGTLLAQANFTSESASGWQQVTFATPVAIQANTIYVAGYLAPKGRYSANGPTLAAGVDNPPIHAVANNISANGVYKYGSTASFPTSTYQSSNYWVDVLFAPSVPAQAPGQVSGVSATAGQEQATVSWTPPSSDGGSAITSYRVTPYIGTTAQTPVSVTAPASSKTITGLSGGIAYTFKVAAINAIGTGPDSTASNTVTPTAPAPPGAPTGVSATAGQEQATVSWTAPSSDGGSAITSYRVTPYIGTTAQSAFSVPAPANSKTITGLSAGTTYTFRVAAVNAVGPGLDSAASNAVTPTAPVPPGAPTGVNASGGQEQATVSWTPPSSDGGSAITSYRVTPYIGTNAQTPVTVAAPATSKAITGLTAGTAYTFTVTAINAIGAGTESAASNAVTPTAPPQPPGQVTGVLASAGQEQATVSWTPPSSDGGSAITSYRVTPYIGTNAQTPVTVAAPATSKAITGLTAGTAYTFTVTAINAIGAGTESAASNAITPTAPTAPDAPTGVSATAGLEQATVNWAAPGNNGGSAITGYRITPYIGTNAQTPVTVSAPASSKTITGLTGGTTYTFTVAAINAIGTGPESAASNSVTPTALTPPSAPTGVGAAAGQEQATVNWSAPANNGGSPITGYRVTPYIGSTAQTPVTVTAPASSKVITGLTGGTAYTFTVAAINAIGTGPESAASNAVTPTAPTAPGAPTAIGATPGAQQATVNWTAPANDGGSPITSYRVTPYIGSTAQTPVSVTAPASSKVITGLSGGTAYTFTVAAINAIGTGPESAASNAVTPTAANPPGAPTAVTATAKSSGAQLSWTAPTSSGGSPISGYRITPYIGSTAQTPTTTATTATTANVGGLTNGTAYTFTVAAINATGPGPESSPSSATTPYDTIFDLATPSIVDSGDTSAVELGVKFRSDAVGSINGIRFYKSSVNIGTHIGSLWSSTGTLLGQATFSGESASGWQQVKFASPVAIQPNTTYVAGYLAPRGRYSVNGPTFSTAVDNAPLHGLANTASANGVYIYSSTARFPTNSFLASNYWVDVLFTPAATAQAPGQVTGVSATAGQQQATVNWTAPANDGGTPITSYRVTPYIGSTPQTPVSVGAPASSKTVTGLTAGAAYTFKVAAINAIGAGSDSAASNVVTPTSAVGPGVPTSVSAEPRNQGAVVSWTAPENDGGSQITSYRVTPYIGSSPQAPTTVSGLTTSANLTGLTNGSTYFFTVIATTANGSSAESAASGTVVPRATIFEQGLPELSETNDSSSVELGVKFRSDIAGTIRGIRFYKDEANTGPHIVSLWSSTGTLLAQASTSAETATGWQEVSFASPVSITANTTYVASYFAPEGHYASTGGGLSSAIDNPPLHALANTASPNGVYAYSATTTFPTNTFNATNYWVDVFFVP